MSNRAQNSPKRGQTGDVAGFYGPRTRTKIAGPEARYREVPGPTQRLEKATARVTQPRSVGPTRKPELQAKRKRGCVVLVVVVLACHLLLLVRDMGREV